MHGRHIREPLKRRGFTLLELIVGLAIAGAVAVVSAGIFKAGFKTYNYAYRQTRVLTCARQAITGDGPRAGLMWAAQSASSVAALSGSSLAFTSGGSSFSFYLSGGDLYSSGTRQAESVASLNMAYYNMDAAGHIMRSTAPESVMFVTARISMQGRTASDKEYSFMSGTQLRNSR